MYDKLPQWIWIQVNGYNGTNKFKVFGMFNANIVVFRRSWWTAEDNYTVLPDKYKGSKMWNLWPLSKSNIKILWFYKDDSILYREDMPHT